MSSTKPSFDRFPDTFTHISSKISKGLVTSDWDTHANAYSETDTKADQGTAHRHERTDGQACCHGRSDLRGRTHGGGLDALSFA
ncbi:MAG: hypothetical protein Q4D96_07435 [Propionibacteriaceae bacterium]|nr:hypothetical protein [Propionibacteriaceae bacterium]